MFLWNEMHLWTRQRNGLNHGGYQIFRMQRSLGSFGSINTEKFQLVWDILCAWVRIKIQSLLTGKEMLKRTNKGKFLAA